MPIRHAEPPPGAHEVLAEHLATVLHGPGGVHFGREDQPEAVHVVDAQPVYRVGLPDLVAGRLLEAARLAGWNYLVFVGRDDEHPVGVAHLSVDPADGSLHFGGLARGPGVRRALETLHEAEALSAGEDAEPRLLEIPGMRLQLLWLHGASDRLLPLTVPSGDFREHAVLSPAEVVKRLRPGAARRAAKRLEDHI